MSCAFSNLAIADGWAITQNTYLSNLNLRAIQKNGSHAIQSINLVKAKNTKISVQQNVINRGGEVKLKQKKGTQNIQAINFISASEMDKIRQSLTAENIHLEQKGGTKNYQAVNISLAKNMNNVKQLTSSKKILLKQSKGSNNIQAVNIAKASHSAKNISQTVKVQTIKFNQDMTASRNVQAANVVVAKNASKIRQRIVAKKVVVSGKMKRSKKALVKALNYVSTHL